MPEIDKYAARLLMISFFLPMKVQALVVMAVCVYFVASAVTAGKQIPRSNFLWAFILGSVYLLYLFAIPMTAEEDKTALLKVCGNRVSLLLMPFAFAVIAPVFGALLRREMIWFVFGSIVSCIVGNVGFAYKYYFVTGKHILTHSMYRITFEAVNGIHPTYMGMYLVLSIFILLSTVAFSERYGKAITYGLFYLLLIFLLALLAKSPLVAFAIIFIHYGYLNRQSLMKHKVLISSMLVAVIAACYFIPFVGQRVQEISSYFGFGKHGSVADNSVYIRKLIWDIDTSLLKDNWLTGVGPGSVVHLLHEHYFFYSLANHFNVGYYDPHNEYFYVWLSFGIIGIVLFLLILAIQFARSIIRKDHLYTYLLIILTITFFTETVLSRQMGVLFYSVFTSFFFFLNSDDQTGDSKEYQ